MTELAFLVELLTQHKIPKALQSVILERIKEVECSLRASREINISGPAHSPSVGVNHTPAVNPVSSSAAADAMALRNRAISDAMAGRVDKTTGHPPKFRGEL